MRPLAWQGGIDRIRTLDEVGDRQLQQRARQLGESSIGVSFAPRPFNRTTPETALYLDPKGAVERLIASLGADAPHVRVSVPAPARRSPR